MLKGGKKERIGGRAANIGNRNIHSTQHFKKTAAREALPKEPNE